MTDQILAAPGKVYKKKLSLDNPVTKGIVNDNNDGHHRDDDTNHNDDEHNKS